MSTHSKIKFSSYVLVVLFCTATLYFGLLPGVLSACLGFMTCRALSSGSTVKFLRLPPKISATIVIISPLLLLGAVLANAKGMALGAVGQYSELLRHLSETVLELREKLPPAVAMHVPDQLIAVQEILSDYLKSQASGITHMGRAWLQGTLLAYVGLVVGALMHASEKSKNPPALRKELRIRGTHFLGTFEQIVMAQFWIAVFNSSCTAVFLFGVLPYFGQEVPYTASLVLFTFLSSLVPVVGNLVCNGVLALAGVSVSPMVGLACLAFLIAIHKAEYLISSRVLGTRTNTAVWELLAVLFVGEAIFGVLGLVAAPLYYAYAKRELHAAKLI
jgi:predicted PurR-regulated permease PerM